MRKRLAAIGLGAAILGAAAAGAGEIITYIYDSRGRLVKVERSGDVNDKVVTNYAVDDADNRTLRNISGAGSSSP